MDTCKQNGLDPSHKTCGLTRIDKIPRIKKTNMFQITVNAMKKGIGSSQRIIGQCNIKKIRKGCLE